MSVTDGQQRAARKVLIVCLGNPDRGDDGIGAAVARLLDRRLPADVLLKVRGGDMLALIDDWAGFDAVVCVDAAAMAASPGRIHRIDLSCKVLPADMTTTSGHAFGLAEAFELARTLECAPASVVVFAIEGETFETGAPMTAAVASAASEVARRVIQEVRRLQLSEVETSANA
jgi:hydrogenase maturation protease